jgi:hypothetical protein
MREFSTALKNRFAILPETIGYRKSTKTEWISNDTWKTIEQRKHMKKKLLDTKSPRLKEQVSSQYRETDREVKNSARQDKRQYIEQLAEEAERAAEQNDMKTVYMITKKLRELADKTRISQLKHKMKHPSQKNLPSMKGGKKTFNES